MNRWSLDFGGLRILAICRNLPLAVGLLFATVHNLEAVETPVFVPAAVDSATALDVTISCGTADS